MCAKVFIYMCPNGLGRWTKG